MSLSRALTDREYNKFSEGQGGKTAVNVIPTSGTDINPLARFVEAIYSNENKTVTYNYYESASKVTLYNSITTTFSIPQDTSFVSAEWS